MTIEGARALINSVFLGESRIVGSMGKLQRTGGSVEIGIDVCLWNTEDGSLELVFYSQSRPLGSVEEAYGEFVRLDHCIAAYRDSLIFLAPDLDKPEVLVFTADGECTDTVSFQLERQARSMEEIELEVTWRKLRDGNLGEWFPSELEPGITQLQVQDSAGLLWVCHGSLLTPEFEVFNINGEHAFSCSCTGLPARDFYRFCISDEGCLAYTMYPELYPRVYFLELLQR
ncbi:hypothetical protein CSA37_13395 [Candidatus Fermentibacteria bacterium]|nr:MAG: hypothetical protein CSA37_13395 [Candidatus Fermentibacteria bacterium]